MKFELNNQIKEEVWNRQKGMCGLCGKKFEEISENLELAYSLIKPNQNGEQVVAENTIMLCKVCENDLKIEEARNFKKYIFPFANFAEYTAENVYSDLKSELELCSNAVQNSNDMKFIQNSIKDIDIALKNVTIADEYREEFVSEFSKIKEISKKRYDEFRQINEQKQSENYTAFKPKLDAALKISTSTKNFKQAREGLINLQNELKDLTLNLEQRTELFNLINHSFEELHRRQIEERECYEMECIENYHNLKSKVEEAVVFSDSSSDYRKIREKLIAVQGLFKGLKLLKEQRDELYSKIQNAFDILNKKQEEEREVYGQECDKNYAILRESVDKAISFADTSDEFKQAREQLISAQNLIKGMKLTKNQRDELYATIRTTFDNLNKRQFEDRETFEKESSENYIKLKAKVDEACELAQNGPDFRQIRDILIAAQNDIKILKLKREHRNELFTRIRKSFDVFDNRRNNYRDSKKDEKIKKLGSILSNLEGRINFLQESIERDQESFKQQQTKLDEAIQQQKEETVQNDIKEKIKAIELRIIAKRDNITEIKTRIDDIQTELNQLLK